ncbi:MAG: putative sugar nucleotidyl transferase [Candidatus Eisenbacteria bacterium]|nr:putative sugar nucleotidyl transferase [Candidatus Eisenbacteria bacterium]
MVPIFLIEDEGWRLLRPFTWLRPAAELLAGAAHALARWEQASGMRPRVVCRPLVAALEPHRIEALPPAEGPRLIVRDRWVPETRGALEMLSAASPAAFEKDGKILAVLTAASPPPAEPPGSEGFWRSLASEAPTAPAPPGRLLGGLPDLLLGCEALLASDLEQILRSTPLPASLGDGFAYAQERVRLGDGCRIDAGCVLDAREGPIVLGPRVHVFPHTWLHGPLYVGEGCRLQGGRIGGGTVIGPGCRIHGEVEASTFLGFDNKAHDGYVGHSYCGEWVNLGALTTTSDLKNNYGTVRLTIDGATIDTGQQKVGSFLGDHVKTRIGTMLNSGTVAGLAANVIGERSLFPKWIPDFAWGAGADAVEYRLDRCLATMETVLGRRGQSLTPALRDAIGIAYRESGEARTRFLRGEREVPQGGGPGAGSGHAGAGGR